MSNRLKEICDNFESELTKFEEQKRAMVEKLRPTFKELFKEFFERNPQIEFITWTQFTPYFNDGDECIFRVNDLYGFLSEEEMEDDPWDGTFPLWGWRKPDVITKEDLKEKKNVLDKFDGDLAKIKQASDEFDLLQTQFRSIDESLLKEIFGDHVRVIASRDGLDVDNYEHD